MSQNLSERMMDLRRALLTMCASVEGRVAKATKALLERDEVLAKTVKTGDAEIDRMDIDIESECLEILALQQPVAGDLRFVVAALRIEADLERVGDLAKGIAKRVIAMGKQTPIAYPDVLRDMAEAAQTILGNSIRALAEGNASLAAHVRGEDRHVDDFYKAIVTWAVQEVAEHSKDAKSIVDLLSVVRAFERIGDLSTNIAESVIFVVEGEVVRHAPV
ncbi:MAG TPA: phosphate signaling complex protein PhoU [Phycisphaerales bacterium]|nr:phosphate signaling complex protein PhoU [Phycisphaerales bacterium]